ncbi:glycoside hydrolase family 25 protein [Streptomyces fractus]|uniref:glycoside hydrolase family 25 protein n=1 Tax=Streptomyces fractus TaxID=641806 RepID=UPI003CF450A2
MTIKGVDVSAYQSATYSLTGFDFVVVKATEGTSYLNPRHSAQVKRARDNGRVVGHYHFVRDGSMTAQVDYFLRHAGAQADEFLALDWEDPSVSSVEKDAFLRYLKSKAGGRKVILYCNVDYWKNRDRSSYAADGLWIAGYNGHAGRPGIQASWLIHQYTSTPVDTNVANFASRAAMATWSGAKTTTPAKPATSKPSVSVAHLNAARTQDIPAKTGHTTYPTEVKVVEAALKAEGFLSAKYATDGSWGTLTDEAYNRFRREVMRLTGKDATGSIGLESLKKLAARHGFTAKA